MSYCKPFKRGVSWRSQNFGDNATIYGPHSGNDDAAPIGTPVHAAGDGYVDWAGEFDDTYLDNLLWLLKMGGNILVLNCGANEPSFVYGHLNSFTVKRGDWVRKGQVIAYSGNTGTATTGAHLHTEAIPPGYSLNSPMLGRVNPDTYLIEWPEDVGTGSLTPQGTTITPLEEGFLMALSDEEQLRVLAAADRINGTITDPNAKVLTEAHLPDVATHVLNKTIARGGAGAGIGDGLTSLGAMVAWNDDHTIQVLAAAAASAASDGASVEEIKAAVTEAMAQVVKVQVSVEGAK